MEKSHKVLSEAETKIRSDLLECWLATELCRRLKMKQPFFSARKLVFIDNIEAENSFGENFDRPVKVVKLLVTFVIPFDLLS